MARDTLAYQLTGEVLIEEFDKAFHHWSAMVRELSSMIARKRQMTWAIEEMRGGSARVSAHAYAEDVEDIERVDTAYLQIARSLETNRVIPFPRGIRNHAKSLVRVVDTSKRITTLSLES